MDFPDQNVRGLPLTEARMAGDSLHLRLAPAAVSFAGRLMAGDSIVGTFAQGAQRFPLTFRRPTPEQLGGLDRPQEPKPPYPYREEEVRIAADSGIVLAGTLTPPPGTGRHPAVLLLPGSGQLDRDASVAGHRPFLVLADALTRRGFVVLRYAKRGMPPSSGDFATATTADLARDAEFAVRYLRRRGDVDSQRVALIGHSEGALVAAMVAGQDSRLGGTVLLGAPGLRGDSLMVVRASALLAGRGLPDSTVRKDAALRAAVFRAIIAPGDEATTRARAGAVVEARLQQLTDAELSALGYSREAWSRGVEVYLDQLAWFRYWFSLDPNPLYGRMHGPVLALYGGLDQQVPPPTNAPRVRAALAGRNAGSITEILPTVNHQMQTATTGSPDEYGRITETVAPVVLDRVVRWLLETLPLIPAGHR
jgi:pimeloyl-ACP methyl ester carboxylesterase